MIEKYLMPTIPGSLLNKVCKDEAYLRNINLLNNKDHRIRLLIGAGTFTATGPQEFKTARTGTPDFVFRLTGSTLTAPYTRNIAEWTMEVP